MGADEAGAIWMPVPNNIIFPGYDGHKPKWLVIHKTASAGTAQNIAAYFANLSQNTGWSSVHYVVGQDGTVVQCVAESNGAGGNGVLEAGHASYFDGSINPNCLTLSIEHCDPASDNSTPLTPAQQAASFKLVRDICQRHTIPMRAGDANGGIIGHNAIAPISRARCPGNYPWAALWAYLSGNVEDNSNMMNITDPFAAAHFTQVSTNPTRWQCSNGFDLFAGCLAGWRLMNGAPRLPLSNEIQVPGTKNAVYQECESGILVYDPGNELDSPDGPWQPCYLLKLDSPLAKQLLPPAQSPIDTADALIQLQSAQSDLQKAESDLKN